MTLPRFPCWLYAAVGSVLLSVLAVGCDTSVQPFVDNGQSYSVYSLLDAGADTQFVRVEALRDSVQFGSPPTLDATVTIENQQTGRTTQLTDSLATVPPAPGIPIHLFWAELSLTPGGTYQVRVERSDGQTSTATVTLPDAPPTLGLDSQPLMPCIEALNEGVPTFIVTGADIEQLAGAYAVYPVFGDRVRRSAYESIVLDRDTFRIRVDHVDDLVSIGGLENVMTTGGCPRRESFDADTIYVAAATAGPDWPEPELIDSLSIETIARPDFVSNVENGAGFVGGIYTDTLSAPINWD